MVHRARSSMIPLFVLSAFCGRTGSAGASELTSNDATAWWRQGVIYQVYPRSFLDGCSPTCSGMGSLRGITSKLQHLHENLGVNTLWISPIYDSPMADFGYDVSNFTNVWPPFGDVEDARVLVKTAKDFGLRVLLDFVPNHSSNKHPWFLESRNKTSAKRDWYIWRKGSADGGPPNNWRTIFCTDLNCSAWEKDEASGEYYYHQFLKEQPDLNWRNPEVVEAMHSSMRFWLDIGVSGFRVDAGIYLLEDGLFRDEPKNPDFHGDPLTQGYGALIHTHTENQDGLHTIIQGMQAVLQEYGPDKMMIGEIYGDEVVSQADVLSFYGTKDKPEFNMPFNMNLIGFFGGSVDGGASLDAIRNATKLRITLEKYYAELPGAWAQPNFVLGNHDVHRVRSRIGGSEALARSLMLLLLTLRGTPTVYNGDEFGMMDGYVAESRSQDPTCVVDYHSGRCRDAERTPLQWTAGEGPNAGFTGPDRTPWLPVSADYVATNVADQLKDTDSFLALMKLVLSLRTSEPSLHAGELSSFACGSEQVLCFVRTAEGSKPFLVAINLGSTSVTADASAAGGSVGATGRIAIDSIRPSRIDAAIVRLAAVHLEVEQSLVIDLALPAVLVV